MLSSRFDPSCTGFSPKSTNGSPFSQAASDSMGVTGRVLRPRRKDKGFARKRRHFYEVCSRDMDPYWVIKQRIRVFWPLDQSWYFGLVKDYNPVTKLHHVKYDDREEEWIDLQNERFKLLLFPSELRGKSNSFGQSIASVPVPFLGMHLKFLMEKNATAIQKLNKAASQECVRNSEKLTDDSSPVEDSSDLSEITLDNVGCSVTQAISGSEWLSCSLPKVETDSLSVSNDAEWMRSTCNSLNGELNVAGNSSGHQERSCSSFPEDISSPEKSDPGCSVPNKINSQTPMLRRADSQRYDRGPRPHLASDLSWNMNDFTFRSPNPTAPRSVWNRNKHSSIPSFSNSSKFWPDGGSEFLRNGSISGCRKPRSQISYLLPFGPGEIGSKPRSHRRRGRPYKKIKPDEEKKTSGGPASSRSRREPLICDANLLVSSGDRGWRECGAKVVLEFNDHRDWRILVKVSGSTRYSHKAHQFLQPGSTNRYTHAMMWKGGKDWTLEFSDRSQWVIFKEMYEECYNRNVRAASVKNIPIPGVRLIEDSDDYVVETPFVRSSSKYFRQVGTEVDLALDPCCVLYDMDSEDEDWLSKSRNLMESGELEVPEISHEVFEKVMDMFEKVAYAQKREEFMGDEMEHLMGEVGPLDVVKAIYQHWLQKRKKKGMPLIRQFQPALWERYQEQVKQWELVISNISNTSNGGKGKVASAERPPMFAFCLRPRGLEVPNKGSKQRSHKKISHMGSDTDEFKLRDASSEAQHLSNMAKLKREKAQWLLHKADLALHKATVALTIAEAIKASEKDLIGDG
ncbi:hypothetical protein QJS04_geneDACA023828 [Acorus gramineus]|uniref:Enhancer of polycomb-like protein n=1 Tax=Acorus gramineus TaxID=55184 RepID=A0AAV9ALI2_ACOGR|nr:hypothetical protein QJS04_geneDACA023828 [Acorus gramineus]